MKAPAQKFGFKNFEIKIWVQKFRAEKKLSFNLKAWGEKNQSKSLSYKKKSN